MKIKRVTDFSTLKKNTTYYIRSASGDLYRVKFNSLYNYPPEIYANCSYVGFHRNNKTWSTSPHDHSFLVFGNNPFKMFETLKGDEN